MRYAQDELKDNHASVEKIVAAAFLNGIDYAENHQHWINVKDELPKEHGAYLVLNRVSNTQDIYVWSNGEWWYNAFKCPSGVITHWMPLPEPQIHSNVEKIGKNVQQKGGQQ